LYYILEEMKTSVNLSGYMILTLWSLSVAFASAQNYKAVKTDAAYYFMDPGLLNVISIRIDSALSTGNGTYYYNFKQIRASHDSCSIADGASWLGDEVIEKPDGTFIINKFPYSAGDSVHTYTILTQSVLNQPWHFYNFHTSTDYVEARLTEIKMMSFLNLTDSVRILTLTRKNSAGEIIESTVNTQKLLLSKNYGIIRILKFDNIPYYDIYDFYDLAGKTNPETGITNLKTLQIYDFEPGDEFHTAYFCRSSIIPYPVTRISTISRVLEKITYPSGDSVSYRMERCQSDCLTQETHGSVCEYSFDTIFQTYSCLRTPEFETEPLETVPVSSLNNWTTYTTMGLAAWNSHILLYNIPLKYIPTTQYWSKNGDCYSPAFDGSGFRGYYLEYYYKGLGGPYYYFDEPAWGPSKLLVYYKKGSEVWGTPLDCDSLRQVGIQEPKYNQPISIYPNPTEGKIIILSPPDISSPYRIVIYDISGRLITGFTMNSNTQAFDVSGFTAGIYICRLEAENGLVYRGKIIRQ